MPVIDWSTLDPTIIFLRKRRRMNSHEIAPIIGMMEQTVRRRLVHLGLMEPPIPRGKNESFTARLETLPPDGKTIVDVAHRILRMEGYSEKRLSVMTLDERMRTANGFLFKLGQKQLGRKPEWLHK